VLGLALLSTAGWLLFVLALEAGQSAALLAGTALASLLAVLAWHHRRPARRRVATTAALALSAVVLVPTLHHQAVPIQARGPDMSAGLWHPFDETSLRAMLARKKIVFVDVTAAWCLTCKVNELTVLDRAPVADRLRSAGVVAMRADWTRPDPVVTAYLQSFGRYGVPLDVVYGPGATEGIALPELLTPQAVMDALRQAGTASHRETAQRTPE
jgi:suppressor for copper-sensitivity B